MNGQWSKAGLVAAGSYAAFVMVCVVYGFAPHEEANMAAVVPLLATLPWSLAFSEVGTRLDWFASKELNLLIQIWSVLGIFLGGAINTVLIYWGVAYVPRQRSEEFDENLSNTEAHSNLGKMEEEGPTGRRTTRTR